MPRWVWMWPIPDPAGGGEDTSRPLLDRVSERQVRYDSLGIEYADTIGREAGRICHTTVCHAAIPTGDANWIDYSATRKSQPIHRNLQTPYSERESLYVR